MGIGLIFLLFFIIIFIIVLTVAIWLIDQGDEDPVCEQCPMRNCNITGTPYFDPEFPYFFNGMECVKFSDADPINFSYYNRSNVNFIRIVPLNLSEDNTCSNLVEGSTSYFQGWFMPNDSVTYIANRVFITDGSFLSLFSGLEIKFYPPTSTIPDLQITLNGNPVGTSVVIPSTDFLSIGVSNLQDGSLSVYIQTFLLEDGSLNPINIQT